MPFTGSHPAAVLPLTYLGLSTSALVFGSLAPDLPYYLPWMPDSARTHSLVGIVTVNPILGLVSLALWHTLVAPLALAVSPASIRRRVPPGARLGPRAPRIADVGPALLLLVAVIAGSGTHVLWDEFTHVGRFGARQVSWLATPHGLLPGYRWAQYASGVFGAAVLALALWRWYRTAPRHPDPGSALQPQVVLLVWAAVLGAAVLGAASGITSATTGGLGLRRALFLAATGGGGAALLVIAVAALACAPRLVKARNAEPSTLS